MALATYSDLKTAIANEIERADLTAQIPDFITRAESRINRRLRRSNLETEIALTGIEGSRFIALPSNFDTAVALFRNLVSGRELMRPVAPAQMETIATNGRPNFWCIDGTSLAFERPCDQGNSFTLRLNAMLGLSDAAPTNSILTQWPDLYLYGAVVEAAMYMLDDDRMGIYERKFTTTMDEVGQHEGRNQSLTTLRVDLPSLTRRKRLFNVYTGT